MASPDSDHTFRWHYGELDDKNFQIHGRSSILVVVIVFSLLLFFILLCLYVKWARRYRHLAAAVSAASQQQSPSAAHQIALTVAGLDRDAINRLPVHILSTSAEEVQCSICLSNLVEGEKVKVLPGCNHGFHPECVDEWLKGQSSCPLCRASLTAESVQPTALV